MRVRRRGDREDKCDAINAVEKARGLIIFVIAHTDLDNDALAPITVVDCMTRAG
jgi:hypothetical protein